MSKPGRKPHAIPSVSWRVSVRMDIAAKVELLLSDPMRDKIKYAARSDLIEALLERWVADQQRQNEESA